MKHETTDRFFSGLDAATGRDDPAEAIWALLVGGPWVGVSDFAKPEIGNEERGQPYRIVSLSRGAVARVPQVLGRIVFSRRYLPAKLGHNARHPMISFIVTGREGPLETPVCVRPPGQQS